MGDAALLLADVILAVFVVCFYAATWFREGEIKLDRILKEDENE